MIWGMEAFKRRNQGRRTTADGTETLRLNAVERPPFEPHTCSPIGVLPPEILAEVFAQHIQLLHAETDIDGFQPRRPFYEWLYITHVCKYWREVAALTPRLWSDIFLTEHLECLDVFLMRAKQTPLRVVGVINSWERAELLYEIGQQAGQTISSLHLQISHIITTSQGFLPPLETLNVGFPILREYRVQMLPMESDLVVMNRQLPFLPSKAPLLERMEFGGRCLALCNLLIPPALKCLILRGRDSYLPSTRQTGYLVSSMSDVCSTLKSMPLLEELAVDCIFPFNVTPTKVVHLPHLRVLTIKDSAHACECFLASISTPQARIQIEVRYPIIFGGYYHYTRPHLDVIAHLVRLAFERSNISSRTEQHCLRSLSINRSKGRAFYLQGWTAVQSLHSLSSDSDSCSTPQIDLQLSCISPAKGLNAAADDLLRTLLSSSPLSSVIALHVGDTFDGLFSISLWSKVATLMPQVEELSVAHDAVAKHLLSISHSPSPTGRSTSSYMVPFPRLRYILLSKVHLAEKVLAGYTANTSSSLSIQCELRCDRFCKWLCQGSQFEDVDLKCPRTRKLIVRHCFNVDKFEERLYQLWSSTSLIPSGGISTQSHCVRTQDRDRMKRNAIYIPAHATVLSPVFTSLGP